MCIKYKRIGGAIVCTGVIIILGLILPTTFWWFLLGVALIIVGIKVSRCKKRK